MHERTVAVADKGLQRRRHLVEAEHRGIRCIQSQTPVLVIDLGSVLPGSCLCVVSDVADLTGFVGRSGAHARAAANCDSGAEGVLPVDTEVGLRVFPRLEELHLDRDEILRFVDALQILGHPPVLLARGHNPQDVAVGIVDDLRSLRGNVDRKKLAVSGGLGTCGRGGRRLSVGWLQPDPLFLGSRCSLGVAHRAVRVVFERLHAEHNADLVDDARRLGLENALRILQRHVGRGDRCA